MLVLLEDIDTEVPVVSGLALAELTAGRNALLPKSTPMASLPLVGFAAVA